MTKQTRYVIEPDVKTLLEAFERSGVEMRDGAYVKCEYNGVKFTMLYENRNAPYPPRFAVDVFDDRTKYHDETFVLIPEKIPTVDDRVGNPYCRVRVEYGILTTVVRYVTPAENAKRNAVQRVIKENKRLRKNSFGSDVPKPKPDGAKTICKKTGRYVVDGWTRLAVFVQKR